MQNAKEIEIITYAIAKEKGIDQKEIMSFFNEGIASTLKKDLSPDSIVHVNIDIKNNSIEAWRLFKLVDSIKNIENEMLFSEVENEVVMDGFAWDKINFSLGRQKINTIKQIVMQKIQAAARKNKIDSLLSSENKLLLGKVIAQKKDGFLIDIAGLEINLPRKNLLPEDTFKVGAKIPFVLEEGVGGGWFGTRTSVDFILALLRQEVPMIQDGSIDIIRVARLPGFRTKVAVKLNKEIKGYSKTEVKPNVLAFCVGQKGKTVKNIQDFLPGEYIDFIEYNDNLIDFFIKAIAPVQVSSIVFDEDKQVIEASIVDDMIGFAIGKAGKNIQLMESLLGVKLKLFMDSQWNERKKIEKDASVRFLMTLLDCDEDLGLYLVDSGISSLEEIAFISEAELLDNLPELDKETVLALKNNAKESLRDTFNLQSAKNLYDMCMLGLNQNEIAILLDNETTTINALSDLSSYDLIDICTGMEKKRAEQIIMGARQIAFIKENRNEN